MSFLWPTVYNSKIFHDHKSGPPKIWWRTTIH